MGAALATGSISGFSNGQLKSEQALLDQLKPGEDLVALQHAFDAADVDRE